jgi:aminoglycoside phosphotransferase family enzyme/predicted kinase
MRAAEPELVRDLLRMTSYPEPHPSAVSLVTTHISWVFLTDHEAWKVKRPVDFGFVDFSDAAKRLHFCQEEVRLNRRLAPDVYMGVVPVRRDAGGHTFTGDGPVVDHAVLMRRLDDSRSAAVLLERNELDHEHLATLAARLARFYDQTPERRSFGSLRMLVENVEDNLAGLKTAAGSALHAGQLEAVAMAQRQALHRHAQRLADRQATGRIRDGHGDLRLEHVYFPSVATEALVVIDALEFAERFRCADAALDIAFLAMELEAAGRPDLADYFVYRFARESQDYDFYPLLDFYVGYRALVRAKVACLLAADPTTPPAKAKRKQVEAVELLSLAGRHGERSPEPLVVVVVGGLVGAGKSTLAEALARGIGVPVVSSDHTRKHLGGIAPDQRAPAVQYSNDFSERTYEEMLRRAGQVLLAGRSVLLDGTFRSVGARQAARELAAAHGARFLFVEATCDEATLRSRLAARANVRCESDADQAVLERIRGEFMPVVELPAPEHLMIDTRAPADSVVPHVAARVQALRASDQASADLAR